MGIFDKLFQERKTTNQHVKGTPMGLYDLILDWFKEADLSINDFEGNFFQSIYAKVRADEELSYYWENKKEAEAMHSRYFVVFALIYLTKHYPNNDLLAQLFKLLFSEGDYQFKELLSNRRDLSEYCEEKEHQQIIEIGQEIILLYHAIFSQKDANFSYLSGITNNLGRRMFVKNDPVFSAVFNYAVAQDFPEKVFYILSVYNTKFSSYLLKDEDISEENQVEEWVQKALADAIILHNTNTELPLSLEIILDYHSSIMTIESSDIWQKTDYKKRKYIKVKDLPKVSEFIQKYSDDSSEALQNALYILNNIYVSSDCSRVYKEIFKQLVANYKHSNEWLKNVLAFYNGESNYGIVLGAFLTPLIEKNSSKIPFDKEIIQLYEKILLHKQFEVADPKSLAVLSKLCDNIEDKATREFHKLKYSGLTASSYPNHKTHNLDISTKSMMSKKINYLIEQLNLITPSALKSFNHISYYGYDEVEYLKLNINGEDIVTSTDLVQDFNQYFVQHNLEYRLLPIPITKTNDNYQTYYKSSLAFVNQAQFELLTNYVQDNFPQLVDVSWYQDIVFTKNAPALFELVGQEEDKPEETEAEQFKNSSMWAWFKDQYIDELSSKEQWYGIVPILARYKGVKRPNKQWLKEIQTAIDNIGQERFFKELAVVIPPSLKEDFWFSENYSTTLKGIMMTCSSFPTDSSFGILRDIVLAAYTKIPGVGPRSAATGNFALKALTESGDDRAFGLLNIMRNKSKYQRFVNALDKHIGLFADFSDTNPELLVDKSIPSLGFVGNSKVFEVESYRYTVSIEKQKFKKKWEDENGTKLKSAPEEVKNFHPKKLKEITEEVKQANALFKDLKTRIKTYWLNNRTWTGADWKSYIFDHALIHQWIEGMIWKNESQNTEFIVLDNALWSIDDKVVELNDEDTISLWHPVDSDPEIIAQWQQKIVSKKIIQAERQAFREHYPFSETEQEMTASPRFAHHFLEVNKLMAIANTVGWIFTYVHEDVNWPRVYIKHLDLTAHIQCEYSRMDDFIPTKKLIITQGNTTKISYSNQLEGIAFKDIPSKTRSEICRDIDLFIATTSVAHNPDLSATTEMLGAYRNDFLFGTFSENANAKLRKEVLESLLKKLGVKEYGFEGNFLIVSGTINKYKINLGSGFAQVYDSQKHLTIIPDTSKVKKKHSLPLIDDETLNIIIATAIFLTNDEQITDKKLLNLIK